MSDTEVEKWEQKIKDSLLRRDDNLESLMSAMTSAMSGAVEVNGKKMYLSNFGIKTLGYLNAPANQRMLIILMEMTMMLILPVMQIS